MAALTLPTNAYLMNDEEMTYLEGGKVGSTNIKAHWWGYQVNLSGTLVKKLLSYGIQSVASAGAGTIAAVAGCSAAVAGVIAVTVAANFFVIKAIHDGKHGVSFNQIYGTKTITPWRQ